MREREEERQTDWQAEVQDKSSQELVYSIQNESKGATHESNRNREKINDNDKKERREKDTNKCKWISRNKTNTFFIIRKR